MTVECFSLFLTQYQHFHPQKKKKKEKKKSDAGGDVKQLFFYVALRKNKFFCTTKRKFKNSRFSAKKFEIYILYFPFGFQLKII